MAIPVQQYPFMSFAQANPAIVGAQTGLGLAAEGAKIGQMPAQLALLQAQAAQMPIKSRYLEQQMQLNPIKVATAVAQLQQSINRFSSPQYLTKQMLQPLPREAAGEIVGGMIHPYTQNIRSLVQQGGQQPSPSPLMNRINEMVGTLVGMPTVSPDVTQQPGRAAPQIPSQVPPLADQYQQLPPSVQDYISWRPGDRITGQAPTQAAPLIQQRQQQQQQRIQRQQQQQRIQQTPTYKYTLKSDIDYKNPNAANKAIVESIQDQDYRAQVSLFMDNDQKTAGKKMYDRAIASAAFQKFLQDNQASIADMAQKSVYYAGIKGQLGAKQWDTWLNKNPDRLAAYNVFQNTFAVVATNAEKYIDGMGATDSQKEELRGVFDSIESLKEDPQRALEELNMNVGMWIKAGNSDIETAQPSNPGTIERVYGLRPFPANYFSFKKGRPTSAAAQKAGPPLTLDELKRRMGG